MIPTIIDKLEAILAAISISDSRKYHQMWRGKRPYRDAATKERMRKEYIDSRVAKESKEATERSLRNSFYRKMENDPELWQAMEDEVLSKLDEYKQRALKEHWDILWSDEEYTLEDLNDSDAEDELIRYVLENQIFEGLKPYEDYREENFPQLHRRMIRSLKMTAMDDFPYWYEQQPPSDQRDVSKVYSQLFGGKYRLYVDIDITDEDIGSIGYGWNGGQNPYVFSGQTLTLERLIKRYFELIGKTESAEKVKDTIFKRSNRAKAGAEYALGYFRNIGDKNPISIGKIINVVRKKDPGWVDPNGNSIDTFEKVFNQRTVPFKGKICISRHPYDIAGMSTGRGWTSCMNLKDGKFNQYVESSLMNGVLIAYLIKDSDTNINNPTSRLLIKPYVRSGQEMDFEHPNWMLRVSKQYGTVYQKFANVVQKWCNSVWNSRIDGNPEDEYDFPPGLYQEDTDDRMLYREDFAE